MRQPYVYSMPEAFAKDQDVPSRWRLWAVLNGFFINRKKCWASNEWLGEQIKAHKDTVSKGIKELEEMGIIVCERTRRTRLIAPVLTSEIGTNAYLSEASTPISDRHQRLSTSDSNADNKTSESPIRVEYVTVEFIKDGEESPKKPAKYPHSKEVFSWFPRPQKNWAINTTELKHAELLFERGEEQCKVALKFVAENKDDPFCPQVVKPSDLDRKWLDLLAYRKKINS